MGSFKFRLVTYFVLLALLPVVAASWAFIQVAARGESNRVDSRLNAALRVAVASYSDDVDRAANRASAVAEMATVQRALALSDAEALAGVAASLPRTALQTEGLVIGQMPDGPAAERSAVVVSRTGQRVGTVTVWVPLDDTLVRSLHEGAGFESVDRLLLAERGQIVAGAPGLEGTLMLPESEATYVELGGDDYRAVGAEILSGEEDIELVAMTPKAEIDAAVDDLRSRLVFFAIGALAFVGMLAYVFGRPIVRSLRELSDAARAVAQGDFERRVPVRGHDEIALLGRAFNDMASQLEQRVDELAEERARVNDAIQRFGTALAATHDIRKLLPIVVESAVEATGAAGGALIQAGREVATAGDPTPKDNAFEIPLGDDPTGLLLALYPKGSGFPPEAQELARTLAGQATVALDNARLHRRVRRQAITDGLTELANRRQFEDALAGEISRVNRFGGSLALILADLDDFKAINDRHGHQAGDDVLRAFADVLRDAVREIDVPARYGGEEFAVLLPGTDLLGAEHLAERIREDLAATEVETSAGTVPVTASFGVAAFPDNKTEPALLAAADRALYEAKRGGKNRVIADDKDLTVQETV